MRLTNPTKTLLATNTASKMVRKFINLNYKIEYLAEILKTDRTTVIAISKGCVLHTKQLNHIYNRLIKLYCKTKWG